MDFFFFCQFFKLNFKSIFVLSFSYSLFIESYALVILDKLVTNLSYEFCVIWLYYPELKLNIF